MDDIVYEVDCQTILVKPGADIDIGDIDAPFFFSLASTHFKTSGANPSAEEQDEALEDGAEQMNNVVHSFRLQSTTFDKKSYLAYLKVILFFLLPSMVLNGQFQAYMKAVKEKLGPEGPERVKAFESGAGAYAKKIIANFKDFEFVRIFSSYI